MRAHAGLASLHAAQPRLRRGRAHAGQHGAQRARLSRREHLAGAGLGARAGDGFIHWAAYNISATTTSLPANAGAAGVDLPSGGRHAYNDFLQRSYGGPCPPEGPPHKYRFTVFATDVPSIDDAGTPMTWRKLRFIIRDHTLGRASLTALRGH